MPSVAHLLCASAAAAAAATILPLCRRPSACRRDYQPGSGDGSGSYEDGSARPAADTVYAAMHSGCPVLQGEKYIATRWIRASGFDYVR